MLAEPTQPIETMKPCLCPRCHVLLVGKLATCPQCRLAIDWLGKQPRLRECLEQLARCEANLPHSPRVAGGAVPPPPAISEVDCKPALALQGGLCVGRAVADDAHVRTIAHEDMKLRHFVIAEQQPNADNSTSGVDPQRQPPSTFWIAPGEPEAKVFVNGRPVVCQALQPGDLIQAGPFAWVFPHDDSQLLTAPPIRGGALSLVGAALHGRLLEPAWLRFVAGRMIAIVGPSGAGKSTLLAMMQNAPGSRDQGEVEIDGYGGDTAPDEYQRRLGCVAQSDDVLHGDLTAEQAVMFAARLRGHPLSLANARDLLRQVGLEIARLRQQVKNLSGGQRRRVQIAAAIASQPRVLILDEPTSGLDPDTAARIVGLLRNLRHRGCTVILVTHIEADLRDVDGFVRLERQRVVDIQGEVDKPAASTRAQPAVDDNDKFPVTSLARRFCNALQSRRHEATWHFQREWARLRNMPLGRLLAPLGVLPLVFAVALLIATPSHRPELLGFLIALSSIWMGASVGLSAVVDESRVLDHERLLFLRWESWLISKWLFLVLITFAQAMIFWGELMALERFSWPGDVSPSASVLRPVVTGAGWGILLTTGAAVGLGLLISAVAKICGRRELAHFLLPLAMVAQIVFSVHTAGRGSEPIETSYGAFHFRRCAGATNCPNRVTHWLPRRNNAPHYGSFCTTCYRRVKQGIKPGSQPVQEEPSQGDIARPPIAAVVLSYFTLSRYADILLRPLPASDAASQESVAVARRWWWSALRWLIGIVACGPFATWLLLNSVTLRDTLCRWRNGMAVAYSHASGQFGYAGGRSSCNRRSGK